MKDYRYVGEGAPQFVSDMPTAKIQELLDDGAVEICYSEGYADAVACVMDRLRLELEIRSMGLTSRRSP